MSQPQRVGAPLVTLTAESTVWIQTGAARLMEAILEQTIHDLKRFRDATNPIERQIYREAYNWVRSADASHPFAFVPLCEALGFSPVAVRRKLVGGAKEPPRPTLAARIVRAGARAALWLLVLLSLPIAARAAVVRLPDTAIAPDAADAELTLTIDDGVGLEGADITIGYDPVSLSISSAPRPTVLTADCILATNYATPGIVHLSLACPRALTADGGLVTLTVQPQRTGTSVVEIVRCDLNEQAMPCDVKPGSVTIEPGLQPATFQGSRPFADQ